MARGATKATTGDTKLPAVTGTDATGAPLAKTVPQGGTTDVAAVSGAIAGQQTTSGAPLDAAIKNNDVRTTAQTTSDDQAAVMASLLGPVDQQPAPSPNLNELIGDTSKPATEPGPTENKLLETTKAGEAADVMRAQDELAGERVDKLPELPVTELPPGAEVPGVAVTGGNGALLTNRAPINGATAPTPMTEDRQGQRARRDREGGERSRREQFAEARSQIADLQRRIAQLEASINADPAAVPIEGQRISGLRPVVGRLDGASTTRVQ